MSKFLGQNPYLWSLIYAPIAAWLSLFYGILVGFFIYLFPIIALASMGYVRANKFEVIDSYSKTYLALFLPMFIGSTLYAFSKYAVSNIFDAPSAGAHISQTWLQTWFGVLGSILSVMRFIYSIALEVLGSLLFATGFIYSIGFAVGLYRKKQRVVNKKPIYYSIATLLVYLAFIVTFTR